MYSPEIYNTFTIHWGASFENELEATFEKHKELFGERRTEVNAVYEVAVDSSESSESGDGETTETGSESEDTGDDGGLFGFMSGFLGGGDDETSKQLEDAQNQAESGTDDEQQTQEIPITDEGEAYLFALKEVGKARRKDGHRIECKVIGNKRFEVGEWCRVYLPSFDEDSIMFISKVSHDSGADNEWITSLTLVDYPPSLGSGQSNSPSSSSEEDSSDTPTTDGSSLTENEADDSSSDDNEDTGDE